MKTWLITGCSSGLGRSIAEAVLKAGNRAVVTARQVDKIEDMVAAYPEMAVATALDVADKTQIAAAVRIAEARFGGVDVLVNNAGHGFRSAVEEADSDEAAELFGTNFFGPVALIKAVLPRMRERRAGFIVNVSSIAGRLAAPGSGYYSATKFALEGLSDALRKEVSPLGIGVMVVDPGALRTDFAGRSLQEARRVIDDYASTAGKRRKQNDQTHGTQPGDPERGALAILRAVASSDAPFRLLLGSDAIEAVTGELRAQSDEIERWKDLSASVDFPPDQLSHA